MTVQRFCPPSHDAKQPLYPTDTNVAHHITLLDEDVSLLRQHNHSKPIHLASPVICYTTIISGRVLSALLKGYYRIHMHTYRYEYISLYIVGRLLRNDESRFQTGLKPV